MQIKPPRQEGGLRLDSLVWLSWLAETLYNTVQNLSVVVLYYIEVSVFNLRKFDFDFAQFG